jgi:hypothetical protein
LTHLQAGDIVPAMKSLRKFVEDDCGGAAGAADIVRFYEGQVSVDEVRRVLDETDCPLVGRSRVVTPAFADDVEEAIDELFEPDDEETDDEDADDEDAEDEEADEGDEERADDE